MRLTREAAEFLRPLSADYPDVGTWLSSRVAPGLLDGTRRLFTVERSGATVALGIAKNDGLERKVCSLRVRPDYVGRGIGLYLLDDMLKWLGTDKPHLTVSDHKLPQFDRIFERYGFQLCDSVAGLYLPNRIEHAFNSRHQQTLVLPLKSEYFDAIRDGSKPEEFRLRNEYWRKRLEGRTFDAIELTKGYPRADDADRRMLRKWNGYRVTTITHPHFGSEPVHVYAIDVREPAEPQP
jgi:GNAT superfamily N-acetyltransferase